MPKLTYVQERSLDGPKWIPWPSTKSARISYTYMQVSLKLSHDITGRVGTDYNFPSLYCLTLPMCNGYLAVGSDGYCRVRVFDLRSAQVPNLLYT